jgi:hypothetical protein
MGYLWGLADGQHQAIIKNHPQIPPTNAEYVFCSVQRDIPTGQLVRVLVQWLRSHPRFLHMPRGTLASMALAEAFPCPSAPALPTAPAGKGKRW